MVRWGGPEIGKKQRAPATTVIVVRFRGNPLLHLLRGVGLEVPDARHALLENVLDVAVVRGGLASVRHRRAQGTSMPIQLYTAATIAVSICR